MASAGVARRCLPGPARGGGAERGGAAAPPAGGGRAGPGMGPASEAVAARPARGP